MARLHVPKKLTIPIAVMLRYLPTIREDWHFIKDAMCLRDVSPTLRSFLKAPAITINCIYVPLLTAASKAADELSIASVTRGIENPKPRTCLVKIQMRTVDWLAMVLFTAFLATEIVWKVVVAEHRLYYLMDVADCILLGREQRQHHRGRCGHPQYLGRTLP